MKISTTIPILLLQTTNTAHSGPLTSTACADIPMNKAASTSAVLTTTESGVHLTRTLCQLALQRKEFRVQVES
jgi:hypothetical protein